MEEQTWREFKAKMMLAGKTQDQVAAEIKASRTAIRQAVLKRGCRGIRRKLVEANLIPA